MSAKKEQLQSLIQQLVALGESRDALIAYEMLFDSLDAPSQDALIETMRRECEALKQLPIDE